MKIYATFFLSSLKSIADLSRFGSNIRSFILITFVIVRAWLNRLVVYINIM